MTLPQPSGDFEWVQASWGAALRCSAIHTPHIFSTRPLELRRHEDGWRALAAELDVEEPRLIRPRQVHGAGVIVISTDRENPEACAPEGDIIMTAESGMAVAVQAADCVPLIFLDQKSGAVAAAHAGWRGTVARVAQSTTR